MRLAFISVLLLVFTNSARSAEIEVVPGSPGTPDLITVIGTLTPQDFETFRTRASSSARALVALAGPGGNVLAGLQIGEMIRLRNFDTAVVTGTYCASACALAWLGGTRRFMGVNASIGFHAARNGETGEISSIGNAVVGAYLNKIGLSLTAVMYITEAKPETMTWLTAADANRYGIDVVVIPEKVASDSSGGQTERNKGDRSIEEDARAFAYRHFAVESESPESSLQHMNSHLSEVVLFYGKNSSKQEILLDHSKFVYRWPVRRYALRQAELNVTCEQRTDTCHIDAVVDWEASSVARNKKSVGVSTWSAAIFRTSQGKFIITAVTGKVLSRTITSLAPGISATEQ
jgi:ATP-dependent protease ClpP protease subunit